MDFKLYSISKKGWVINHYIIESDGQVIYTVKRKNIFKYHYGFYDSNGLEVLSLRRKFSFFKPKFELSKGNRHHAFIEKSGGAFNNNFVLTGGYSFYYMEGNFTFKEFTVLEGENELAKISRKSLSNKDRYGIAMKALASEDYILALAMVIEIARKLRGKRSGG